MIELFVPRGSAATHSLLPDLRLWWARGRKLGEGSNDLSGGRFPLGTGGESFFLSTISRAAVEGCRSRRRAFVSERNRPVYGS